MPNRDEVDLIVQAWQKQLPEFEFAPLQVFSRIDRLAKRLDPYRKIAFQQNELEPWEFDVLSALRRAGEPYQLSAKALLADTLVSSGTMTNRINRLSERKLVERRTDPDDGRGILVKMTAAGQQKVDSAIEILLKLETELLATLSPIEQNKLSELLRKISLDLSSE